MNKIQLLLLVVLSNIICSQPSTDYVDLFICTAGDHGQLDPAATVPFGMIKLGPDTDPGNHSGYDYNSQYIKGFSHNRIGGVGCRGAGGNLRILPGIDSPNIKYLSIDKESEYAQPSFYKVNFKNGVSAELTSTNQTGFHKYTFPKSDNAFISIDIRSSFGGTISASKEFINQNEFFVQVSAKNVCGVGRYNVFYHVWTNKPIRDIVELDGKFYYTFETKLDEEILFNVTTSSISCEDAKLEWEAETKGISFDKVKKSGLNKWEELLSRIEVEGKEEYKKIFYTHLYHIFLNPVKSENRKKEFKATNGETHISDGYEHYDSWSMWDNFRNKFSLYALLIPDVSNDIANSLIDLYKYGKANWSGYNEPPTVRTEHSIITLLDLYKRGITDFDIQPLYKRLSSEISNVFDKTPDTKLELSYDYWALAQFAKILGRESDYELFKDKSQEYKKVWREYFLTINNKSDIMHGDGLYEGTLWQYRWHVQHDIDGIIEMIGSSEKYTEQLEYFFNNHLYNHGNQPDIHVPFMFNYGTKPWLTQKWVNKILTKDMTQYYGTHEKWDQPYYGRIYKSEPEGYIPEMDDDEGTMSGWYVLSAMGLYPVTVGEPIFQISAPIFDKITISLENGNKFIIKTNNLSNENYYIDSVSLNGKNHTKSFINHKDLSSGGTLEFNLSNKPNKNWGIQ